MPKYRIVTFDGGGICGLLTAILLERISAQIPGWLDKADLFAGTSTGGLIALGLARGLPPSQLVELYQQKGQEIFDDSWLDNLIDMGQISGAQYSNGNLTREVKRILGKDTKLKDLNRSVLIPTFDLDNEDPNPAKRSWKPKFFHNYKVREGRYDGDELAYKVGLYTSAAPTYFPSVDGYVDGGVIANNPSMAALAQTQDPRVIFPSGRERPALSDVVLISFSCGKAMMHIKGKNLDWGFAQWVQPLIRILLNGGVAVADYQCSQILRDNYFRLDPAYPLDKSFVLDDADKIPQLAEFSKSVNIDATLAWIKERWLG